MMLAWLDERFDGNGFGRSGNLRFLRRFSMQRDWNVGFGFSIARR